MSSFRLQSGDSGFNSRVDALFSSLQTAAVDLEPQLRSLSESRDDVTSGEGDKDVFGKPLTSVVSWRGRGRGASAARNSTPDYVKNPQKWTRYNMKDTKLLSDMENKQVGLRLFDELRKRRIHEDGEEESKCDVTDEGCSDQSPKILFKKPLKPTDADVGDDDEPRDIADDFFGGAKKLRLQEYVVGKSTRRRCLKRNICSSLEKKKEGLLNKK
nr:protein TSSC4-like [Cherax quadricarinatus]